MKYIPLLLLLCACATPETVLQNKATGETITCGGGTAGSIAGGMVGYSIQKDNDKKCIEEHKAKGFVIIKHADE
ncbi:MAG: hypothetical protein U1E36_09875 [Rickettsiales bacterium]